MARPAHDDQVWATVAFLRVMPAMDAARYDALFGRLRQPPANELVTAITYCDGRAGNPAFPRLEGLDAANLARQLLLFATGQSGGTAYSHLMEAVARKLEDHDIAAPSTYLAQAKPPAR